MYAYKRTWMATSNNPNGFRPNTRSTGFGSVNICKYKLILLRHLLTLAAQAISDKPAASIHPGSFHRILRPGPPVT